MKKNNPLWILAIIAIFVLVILNTVISIKKYEYSKKYESSKELISVKQGKTDTGKNCPDAEAGFDSAFLQVKYFYSVYCPWCDREEPILQKLAENYSNLIYITWYNIEDCQELVDKYRVSGVPTFVFSTYGNYSEYTHYGFIYEKDLTKLVCDVTGGC